MHAYIVSELAADRHRTLLAEAEAHRLAQAVARSPARRAGRHRRFGRKWFARVVPHL